MSERDELIRVAKLAKLAERYNDMYSAMKELVKTTLQSRKLSSEERNLLSVACINVAGARRSSLRLIRSFEQKQKDAGNEQNQDTVRAYRPEVEKELNGICGEVLKLLEDSLISPSPPAEDDDIEAYVFYLEMKGIYYQYLTEAAVGDRRTATKNSSKDAYQKAFDYAKKFLPRTHPIQLGVALNFSVFYYEILNNTKKACEIAKEAFDSAIAELDHLKEESYKDSTLIMEHLRDNLTLWTSESEGGDDEVGNGGNDS